MIKSHLMIFRIIFIIRKIKSKRILSFWKRNRPVISDPPQVRTEPAETKLLRVFLSTASLNPTNIQTFVFYIFIILFYVIVVNNPETDSLLFNWIFYFKILRFESDFELELRPGCSVSGLKSRCFYFFYFVHI